MKIAVIVIGSLAVLILTVLVIGALLPKHHIATRSATFRAKPERLFALISGPPTWRPDVKKYEVVANPGGGEMWQETDSRLTFSAGWLTYTGPEPSGGSTKYLNVQNATVSFSFNGTGFTLYRIIGTNRGMMEVCIDGVCQQVNNYAASTVWASPVSFNGYASAVHTVTIAANPKATGGFTRTVEIVTDNKDQPSVIVQVTAKVTEK